MRQKLTIILVDKDGYKSRVVFKQGDEVSPLHMSVSGLGPDELMKLMMLLRNLSEHIMIETANMGRENNGNYIFDSPIIPG